MLVGEALKSACTQPRVNTQALPGLWEDPSFAWGWLAPAVLQLTSHPGYWLYITAKAVASQQMQAPHHKTDVVSPGCCLPCQFWREKDPTGNLLQRRPHWAAGTPSQLHRFSRPATGVKRKQQVKTLVSACPGTPRRSH